MPYSTLIITAGISALAPRNEIGSRLRGKPSPLIFTPGKQNPEATDPDLSRDQLFQTCDEFLNQDRTQNPREFNPEEISAEFSVLHKLRQENRLAQGALVHLIHTASLAGQLAVQFLRPILEERLDVQVHLHELSVPFDPSQSGGLALASGAFIGTVSRLLREQDPHTTAFAPIGGYKVMVALGHTAASFHGFSSLYLHEDDQVLQEIAPAPITITPERHTAIAATALHVGNGAEWQNLESSDRQIIESHPAFFTRVDDLVELNELGQFLRLDNLPVLLSPEAQNERNAQPSLIEKQLRQLAAQAATNPDHPGINHDMTRASGRSHPWRIAKMGDGNRIAWQITPSAILIGKIWRDHDTYEKEAHTFIQSSLPKTQSQFISLS